MNRRLKAGMSSGLRLLTSLPSTATSWSTQWPPALLMSSLSDGQLVRVRPCTSQAEISSQAPWQITATGLLACSARIASSWALARLRIWSELITPPGSSRAS